MRPMATDLLDHVEPEAQKALDDQAGMVLLMESTAAAVVRDWSAAISLKRIADALAPNIEDVVGRPSSDDALATLTEIVSRLYLENERGIGWRLGNPGGGAEDNWTLVERAKALVFK